MVILLYRYTIVEVPFQSYAHTAFDIINFPNKFILSEIFKNYQTKVYNTLNGHSNMKRFALLGPKGVGKSTFLMVLWSELLKNNVKVILTSDKAAMYNNSAPVKKYMKDLIKDHPDLLHVLDGIKSPQGYVNFLHDCITKFCETEKEKVVLLLDVCHFNEMNQTVISNLLQLVHSHESLLISIVAISSGSGSQVSGRVNQYLKSMLQCLLLSVDTCCIQLHQFMKDEAELALQLNNTKFTVADVEHITSYNPLLLSLTKSCNDIMELKRKVNDIVKVFLDNNFVSELTFLPQLYRRSLENSVWYFYAARSEIKMAINDELEVYEQSWISKQNICYISHKSSDKFSIKVTGYPLNNFSGA